MLIKLSECLVGLSAFYIRIILDKIVHKCVNF